MDPGIPVDSKNQIPIGMLITEVTFLPDGSGELFGFWYYLLSHYAIDGGLESDRVYGKKRASLFKEFERELFGREAEEPEEEEREYEGIDQDY